MSFHEGLKPNNKVRERTLRLAEEHAAAFAHMRREQFAQSAHLSKLTEALQDRLIARQYARAYQKFLKGREAGLYNDSESLAPGVRALVTAKAVAEFSSTLYGAPRQPGTLEPTFLRLLINGGDSAETIRRIKGEPISDEEWASRLPANTPLAPNFDPAGIPDIYSMSLPAGAYRHIDAGNGREGVLFHTFASFDKGWMVNASPAFKLSAAGIVRIEGQTEGELWQNPAFSPSGEPKEN